MDSSEPEVVGYTGVTASGAGYTGVAPTYASPDASSAANYDSVIADTPVTNTGPINYQVTGQTSVPTQSQSAEEAATSTTQPTTAHEYIDEYEIGPLSDNVSAKSAMQIMKSSPNTVFPFKVEGQNGEKSIELNHSYNLLNTRLPVSSVDANPVKVTQADDTSFTFTTLPGHFRGPGRTIGFQTLERGGKLYLQQKGIVSNNVWDFMMEKAAGLSWWYQAQNLKAAIYGGHKNDFPGDWPTLLP